MVRVISCLVTVVIVFGICHGRVPPSDAIDSVEVGCIREALIILIVILV